jgi:hypothetical protein
MLACYIFVSSLINLIYSKQLSLSWYYIGSIKSEPILLVKWVDGMSRQCLQWYQQQLITLLACIELGVLSAVHLMFDVYGLEKLSRNLNTSISSSGNGFRFQGVGGCLKNFLCSFSEWGGVGGGDYRVGDHNYFVLA